MRAAIRLVTAVTVSCIAVVLTHLDARQQAVFRSEANYVEIVASVTDRQGRFVSGLTAADFEVREQGRRESIDAFTMVELPDTGSPASTAPAAWRADVPAELKQAQGRLFLIYLSGATPENTPLVRRLASQFVRDHLRPGDRAAIWDTQFPLRTVTFTDDKATLLTEIEPYTGAGPLADLPFAYRCQPGVNPSFGDVRLMEECRTALAEPHRRLHQAVQWFNAIQGRRKSIVLFAGGWQGATDPVSRADITLYAVDVRGLVAPPPLDSSVVGFGDPAERYSNSLRELSASVDDLWTLANRTGGFAVINSNDAGRGFEQIIEANSRYYVLGYASSYTRRDRVYRSLDVKVNRPGVKVQARRGYFPRP